MAGVIVCCCFHTQKAQVAAQSFMLESVALHKIMNLEILTSYNKGNTIENIKGDFIP